MNGSNESEFPQLDAAEEYRDTVTTAIVIPGSRPLPSHEDMEYLLKQKLEDLEMWIGFRNRYGHYNLLISSINSDLAVLGRSDQSIPVIEWGEF